MLTGFPKILPDEHVFIHLPVHNSETKSKLGDGDKALGHVKLYSVHGSRDYKVDLIAIAKD